MTGFFQTLARHDRRPALEDGAARAPLSFMELRLAAEDVARRLLALGVGPGRTVAVKGGLSRHYVAALHGCWLAGIGVAPLNPRWNDREEEAALSVLQPSLLLLAEEDRGGGVGRDGGEGGSVARGAAARRPAARRPFSGDVFSYPSRPRERGVDSLEAVSPYQGDLLPVRPTTAAARLLTSGTAGQPAVVTLTFANLMESARASAQRLGSNPSDAWLASLSPAHVGGLALLTRAAFLGLKLVLRRSFRAQDLLALAEEGTVTHASLVPTMLHQLLEAAGAAGSPRALRCLLVGGAPTPRELLEEALTKGYPIALTYGLTEASSQVATAPPELVRRKPGTVGPPLPGLEIRVDEARQILVKGPTLAVGVARSHGWLETGDLGRLDDEGHLWVLGRSSDRILSGGVNVAPEEVEEVIRAHPRVADVAVVGIPDPKWGEVVAAAVVLRSGEDLSEQALAEFARGHVSSARRPRAFRIVEALPRNPNGKIDRTRVRSFFR